jgi:tetratricopeptide (TPR) repeat protein
VGRVHEVLNQDDQVTAEGCQLTYGYSPAHNLDPDRVFRLLWKDVADARIRWEDPGTRTLYYLAREYWYRHKWADAEHWFRERVKQMGSRSECADAWLYIARCCIQQGKPDDARAACANAIILNANFREPYLLMADLSFPENAKRWRQFAQLADNREVLFIR